MGNQLTRDYDFEQTPNASGGPKSIWKVYSGVHRNTKQKVSIFIVHLKELETKFGRTRCSEIVRSIKHEASILAKLRHPYILRILQPSVIESSKEIAIVTERVVGSLTNFSPKNPLHPVELKYGLYQISEALSFCHNEAKIIHLNICPSSIWITENGDWKLGGFNFSKTRESTLIMFGKNTFLPSLNYSAPEYVIRNSVDFRSGITNCCIHNMN